MKNKILQGIGASPGLVTGEVKLVLGLADKKDFNDGNILVTKITDPTMVTMMAKAGAIVCDIGGITSHPAIVSRELGLPCVVNTKEATKKLQNGMEVQVNGNTGEIFLLSNNINSTYPAWIDDFAKGAYGLIGGNVLEGYQPIDFYHFNPLWYDLFLQKIKQAIDLLKEQKITVEEMSSFLPTPSLIRSILIRIIPTLPHLPAQFREDYLAVLDFLVQSLQTKMKVDVFALEKNLVHSSKEVREIILKNKFYQTDTKLAKKIGAICLVAGHLINGLYNDVNTDYAWEVYGPYNVSQFFGEDHEMLVRCFVDLNPVNLWPHLTKNGIEKLQIITVYEKAGSSIHFVGCHTNYKNQPTKSMRWASIKIKTTEKVEIFSHLAEKAEKHYCQVKNMDLKTLKLKSQEQDLYCFKGIFDKTGLDWHPSEEMGTRALCKMVKFNLFSYGKLLNFEEFCDEFGINYLKKLYINRS